MKLLIIGPKSWENIALVEAAKKRGHFVLRASLHEISLMVTNNKMEAINNGKKLEKFDICLFRGISPFLAKAKTLARYLDFTGVKVVDQELVNKDYEFDKMLTFFGFFQESLPCIDTLQFSTFEELSRNSIKIPEPMVIKDICGMHSRGICSFETKKELMNFFRTRQDSVQQFLIQKKVNTDCYYRVLIVGGRALGAMKRVSFFHPRKNKIPLAERSEKAELTVELKELAVRAAAAVNADIAGVDIIFDNKKPKLLEANRSPKFKRFTKVMGINVADKIIGYLEKL
jgi:RimK family alpha-L-glutamate ligase